MTPDEAFEVLAAITHPGVLRLRALDTIRALIDREKRREADQPAATETGPRCPACRATFTEERMVEVGMRCPSCGTRFFRKPEAETAPQGAPPEPLDENWLATRRPAGGR